MAPSTVAPLRHPATGPPPPGAGVAGRVGPAALVAGGVLLVGVLVVALLVGGGRPVAPTAGLPDSGPVTGWGQPVVDLLVRVLAVLTVGQLAYASLLAPTAPDGSDPGAGRALRGGTATAVGWLLAEGAALVLRASSLSGVPVTDLSVQGVTALLTGLPAGRASLWVGLLLVVLVLGGALLSGAPAGGRTGARRGPAVLLLVALAAVVVPVVLAGHSATATDHVPAVVALSVHVVTASLWVGGLAGLLLHVRGRPAVVTAVPRFSTLAGACVALLLASGAAAAFLVAGTPSWAWAGEGWVRLLLAKTVLLTGLAAMGWWHRRRTLPALAAGRPRAFLRLGLVEVAVMGATVAVSVALAASPAPVTAAPVGAGGATPVGSGTAPLEAGSAGDGRTSVTGPAGRPGEVAEDMSRHDHGDLSVSVLVDATRFHVTAPVRPLQRVTVYNSSDVAATITAVDGAFDVQVPARTFITFEAPAAPGEFPFVSRTADEDVAGFADVLHVGPPG